jgi:hypothetical protein
MWIYVELLNTAALSMGRDHSGAVCELGINQGEIGFWTTSC